MEKLEKYAQENNIPIMMKEGIEFLLNFISENNVKNILEIGSAIGYSAIKMASLDKNIRVTTIERDFERYQEAVKNIKDYSLENQITIINDDAFNVELNEKFDLIFIDAAKSQYIKFFDKFKLNLKNDGFIVSDNLNFHGLVDSDPSNLSRNVRGLVRKLNNYVEFLKNHNEFETQFYDLGDGVSISRRKEVLMKKNAFTLVELLGVIVILAAIALVAFPPILNQIQKSQNEIDEATKSLILSAASLYVDENSDYFVREEGNVYCTNLDALINDGLLTEGMLKGTEDIKENMVVKISYFDDFSYEIVPADECEQIISE